MKSEYYFYASFRKSGKVHRGLISRDGGKLTASCSCTGSRNGKLTNGASILCQDEDSEAGWKLANCGK